MSDHHGRFQANVAAHLAEVLSDEDAGWMDAHAAECKDCADLLARVRARLPGLKHEGGHAPVTVLERWVHSPEELTPLERELIERHLADCELCHGDAQEMALLAGLVRSTPKRAAQKLATRRGLTTALVAAAALAVVFAVRFSSWRPPSAPAAPHQPTEAPTSKINGASPQLPAKVPGASQLIELRERMRGGGDSVVQATVPPPGTGVRIRVPRLFLSERELMEARVIRADGAIIWADTLGAGGLEHDLRPPTPSGGWPAGVYRLELVPGAGADTAGKRVFEFALVRHR